MIGVFKSSNGQFFLAWWWPPSKVLGGTQCLDCLLLLLKEFFIPFKPIYLVAKYFSSHLSLAKKYSVQMEPIYQRHTEPLSHPSKKVHSGWKKVNKTFKIQKWEHFYFWWPFGQFWNSVRRGLLIIQCVISALLIFRASDIFCQIDLLGRDQKPLAMLLLQFLEIHSLHFTFFSLDPF